MARYDVIHRETGETKVVECSVHAITKWYEENEGWERDWNKGVATNVGEVGHWKNKMTKTHPGWNDVLGAAAKAPGSRVKKL